MPIFIYVYMQSKQFFVTDNVYFETHLQSPIFLSGDAAIHQTPKKKTWFGGNELLVNGCLIL